MTSSKIIAEKYEIERELGEGGYGKVYLVRHVDLGIRYALKLLTRAQADEAHFAERFRREAEILQRFSHPGSVQLRDFGRTADGSYYMALDFCDGSVLQKILEREEWIPVLAALHITSQVLEVLGAAHGAGIIHRDIKPANIMLVGEGEDISVKILDFGIAKIRENAASNTSVTREGLTIGTPQYMSPEQASGELDLDHRVDLYSTGIVLYELITGSVPFQGDTVMQTLIRHLTQPPPPFAEALGVPQAVEDLVMQALRKEKTERFQTAAEFKAACDATIKEIRGVTEEPDEERAARVASFSTASEPVTGPLPDRPRILCLDDNEMILNISRHLLEKEGYDVFTATNFSIIHDYIFTHGARLMLCDVEMPGLPGTKICRMLKKTVPELKIVLFSNVPERELEKLSAESGADAWVSKNWKPDAWMQKVREMLA